MGVLVMAVLKVRDGQGGWVEVSVPGPTGPVGPAGGAGGPGLTGPTGPQGAQGARGPTGPTGPQGLTGNTGATGGTGAQGPKGNNHYWQIRMGSPSITPVADVNTSLTVSYSAAFRTGIVPTVVISPRSSVIGTTVTNVVVNNVGNATFDIVIRRSNTTATTVDYLAVGER